MPDRTLQRRRGHRVLTIGRVLAVLVGVLVLVAVFFVRVVDEPLRARMERQINASLKGYHARIAQLSLHPLGFAIDLRGIQLIQDANPDPPVADIDRLTASVQWQAVIHGRLVADMTLEHPVLHINTRQTEHEVRSKTPVKERGWQEAVQKIYPLKINLFQVKNGELTYIDEGAFEPIRMSRVNLRAGNIRNVRSRPHDYPSDIHLDGVLLDETKLEVDGNADLLAEPHVAGSVHVDLQQLPVYHLTPIFRRYGVTVRSGVVSLTGDFESAVDRTNVNLQEVTVDRLDVDYASADKPPATQVVEKTAHVAQKTNNDPQAVVRAARVRITRSTFGVTNRGAEPPYRLFVTDDDVRLENFSNQVLEGTAKLAWAGKFMGSGDLRVDGTFRPDTHGPDFNLAVRVENTDARALNELFRAYGAFDVAGGEFDFYSEINVKDGYVHGYVKPLFVNLQIYDPEQERGKSVVHKLYEGIVGAVAGALTNRPRDQVATETSIEGPLENARASTWEIVSRLVQNAFFKAILPGLRRETTVSR